MTVMAVATCAGCDVTFLGDDGARRCAECEAARDPLRCERCGTRLLREVESGLCGICDPEWTEHLEAVA